MSLIILLNLRETKYTRDKKKELEKTCFDFFFKMKMHWKQCPLQRYLRPQGILDKLSQKIQKGNYSGSLHSSLYARTSTVFRIII